MKHAHAELMAAYAADAMTTSTPWTLWEFRDKGLSHRPGEWQILSRTPSWQENTDYRRLGEAR